MYDLELERHFVGSCIVYPEQILPSGVVVDDFHANAHGLIWHALLELVADGSEITTLSLEGRLADSGRLNGIGGRDTLLSLTDGVPQRNVDATRIRRLGRLRKLQSIARMIANAGPDEFDPLQARYNTATLDLNSLSGTGPRAPSLADCIPSIAVVGPRLPLGLPTLDAATRGGVPMGRFVAVIGAPGASKTNLSTWLGDTWERAGCAVLIVAADESRESIVTRLGQMDGHDRDLLEGLDPGRRNAFQRNARGRAISVVDPFADKIMLEQVEAELVHLAAGKPRVLIVDSLQRAPSTGAASFETTREQIEYTVSLLDGIARRGALVIAISEMSRAGYRTGKRDQDASALASGAESRSIEYAAHLQLALKPVRGERGVIDVEVAKNRLGPDKPDVRLVLDFARLGFREIGKPADETADAERRKASGLRERILAAVVKAECKTTHAIIREAGCRKRDGNMMCKELIEEGAILKIDGVYRVTPAASDAQVAQ